MNSTTLVLSTAFRIATATPFFTQSSDRVSGGCPNLPAGRSMVTGDGEDPATMSTSRPVRCCDLLRDRVDPLPRQRVRPGNARDLDPDHADRISGCTPV